MGLVAPGELQGAILLLCQWREYRAAMKSKSGIWYRDGATPAIYPEPRPEWHRPEELLAMLAQDPSATTSGLPVTVI